MKRPHRILITLSAFTLTIMTALTTTSAAAGQPQHAATSHALASGGIWCCGGG